MNVLCAVDSFKGSIDSKEIGKIAAKFGTENNICVDSISVSDGGEGLLEALREPLRLQILKKEVHGPLFRSITAEYGYSPENNILVVEMATASGLPLLAPEERNPMHTSSYGTGELLIQAKELNCQKIILGVGGSATCDAGLGALQALKIIQNTLPVPITGESLNKIHELKIETDHWIHQLEIEIACDVENIFTGPKGSAHVFGPQKCGPHLDKNEMIQKLENNMLNIKKIMLQEHHINLDLIKGSGAAGGIAGSFSAILKAKLISGADLVLNHSKIDEKINKADLILTGEGQLDEQTLQGKLVSNIIKRARQKGKRIHILCGQNKLSPTELHQIGIQKVIQLVDYAPLDECMNNTSQVVKLVMKDCLS